MSDLRQQPLDRELPIPSSAEKTARASRTVRTTTRRRWGFRIACVLVAVAPFIFAELYLRTVHSVDSADLVDDPIFAIQDPPLLFERDESADRWQIAEGRLNFFRPASFAINKPAGCRRIFILGGSTVAGRPYENETAFSQWVKFQLESAAPQTRFEVVNCGGVSYASYRLAIVLHEVLMHQPDAIVIYTGHNEYLEERSYQTLRSSQSPLFRMASRSRVVQTLRQTLFERPGQGEPLTGEVQTRLDLVQGMNRYQRDDKWRRGVVAHFQDSLARMVRACQIASVPLVVCVPASDLVKTPPFKVMTASLDESSSRQFELDWRMATDRERSDQERMEAAQRCLGLDPEHAGAHFILGGLNWNLTRPTLARRHLTAARDFDVCPLRATTAIIDAMLNVCSEHSIDPIRCDRLFDDYDSFGRPLPDGIPDPERFVDHVHPTIAGHQRIADRIAQRLMDRLLIEPQEDWQSVYAEKTQAHWRTLDETYFARGKQRLAGLRNWAAGRAGRLSVDVD